MSLLAIEVEFAKSDGVQAGVPVKVAVAVAVAVEVFVGVFVEVFVDVAVGVAVFVGVPVLVGVPVAVGVLHDPSLLKISENLRIEPVSTPALSETFRTQVPSPLMPLKLASEPVVSGEKLPDSGEPVTLVKVDTLAKPPWLLMFVRQMFSLVPPRLAWKVAVVVPLGAVSLNVRSPIKV